MYSLGPSLGKSIPIGCPVSIVSSKNIHTSNIIQTKQVIFRKMYTYTNKYIYVFGNGGKNHEFEGERGRGI